MYWGAFIFSLANGVCESVINPLVASLYPKQKTHYLNILHAGWPGGLILGGILAYCFVGRDAMVMRLDWVIPMSFFLVPTLVYGLMVLKEKFPPSETQAAGVSFGKMLTVFASPILLFLLLLHAMIGYVELGTDSWITDIMNNVITGKAVLLFIYTSALMFVLRFFAGPIVERINPLGLLCLSALLGCIGLYWLGSAAGIAVVAAATVYGLGKTFLWPTILGVVGERFPQGGALVMGAMGGVGMLSAGLLGGPGIGYKQDYYASQELQESSKETYDRYVSKHERKFLVFPAIAGLDGQKVATLGDNGADLAKRLELAEGLDKQSPDAKDLEALSQWWGDAKTYAEKDEPEIKQASIFGGRMALKWTALVPFSMFVGFLLLVIYFRMQGGYKQEHLHQLDDRAPMEA